MSEPKSQPKSGHRTARIVAALLAIVAALLLFTYRQFAYDQLSVWQYTPTAEISQIADRTTMTDKGEFYFYTSHPSIESSASFDKLCTGSEDGTAILGCYNGVRIYIYDIDDAKLDGIKEVTAAHEMLHVAYDRLSTSEKDRINRLLEQAYTTLGQSDEFKERMAYYERNERADLDNELHSIVATEVENIHPELEAYYAKYFDDRQAIVRLHQSYESVFTELEDRGKALVRELNTLGDTINRNTSRYNDGVAQLNTDIESFNRRARGGGFQTQSQFESERAVLMARAAELEALRTSVSRDRKQYEQLEKEYNQVAIQTDRLNRSINSSLAPAPSI